MQKYLSAALLGAIIVMIWGFISWVVLPWHSWGTKSFTQEGQAVTQAIKSEALEPGVYFLPNMPKDLHKNPESEKQWQEKAKEGPFAFISVKPRGTIWDMKVMLFVQFVIQFIAALIVAWLLSLTYITSTIKNALYVALAVSAGAFIANLSNWNWWGFPLEMSIVNFIDVFLGWFIAGLVMSLIIKRRSADI